MPLLRLLYRSEAHFTDCSGVWIRPPNGAPSLQHGILHMPCDNGACEANAINITVHSRPTAKPRKKANRSERQAAIGHFSCQFRCCCPLVPQIELLRRTPWALMAPTLHHWEWSFSHLLRAMHIMLHLVALVPLARTRRRSPSPATLASLAWRRAQTSPRAFRGSGTRSSASSRS